MHRSKHRVEKFVYSVASHMMNISSRSRNASADSEMSCQCNSPPRCLSDWWSRRPLSPFTSACRCFSPCDACHASLRVCSPLRSASTVSQGLR